MLPVKGGPGAKSRLGAVVGRSGDLALSMALDCLESVLAASSVERAVVVTDDPLVVAAATELGAQVLAPGAPGLRTAVADGLAAAPPGPVAVLLADLPSLRPEDLEEALDAVGRALDGGAGWVFVPDAEGTGTVLLASDGAAGLAPAFGPGSASAHQGLGASRLDLDLPRLRRDVDTAATLEQALALGVGSRTRRSLGAT